MKKITCFLYVVLLCCTCVFATVSSVSRKTSYTIDDTSTFSYSYTFDIVDVASVDVSFFDTDGDEIVITMERTSSSSPSANEYYVNEDSTQVLIGGSGTLRTQYSTSITQLLISRDVDLTQEEAFPTATSLQADTIELALDKNVLMIQEVAEEMDRCIKFPVQDGSSFSSELPGVSTRASNALGFDPGGNLTVISSTGTFSTTNAYWDDVTIKFPRVDIRAHGAIANDSLVDHAAIQAAVDAAAALATDAEVYIPPGVYNITTAIDMKDGVNLVGAGGGVSVISADGCNGLVLDFFPSTFGKFIYRDFGLVGVNGTTSTAIINNGSLDETDEIYGVTIQRILINDFNTGIAMRSVRNLEITQCWLQDVTQGIKFTGQVYEGKIFFNKIAYEDGTGAGNSYGIELDSFNYTGGSGTIPPEGIQIIGNHIHGFDTALKGTVANYVNFIANDVSATVNGIDFTTVQLGFNIKDNYVVMTGTNAVRGIYGRGLASVINSQISIEGNTVQASSTTSCSGIVLHNANQNQNNVFIERNFVLGMDATPDADITMAGAGNVTIIGNKCVSSDPTNSIVVTSVIAGLAVYVDRNYCEKLISFQDAEVKSGEVILGTNFINDGTMIGGYYQGSATFNPANLADGAGETTTVTVTSAALGDFVDSISFSLDLQGILLTAYVSAADTVSVRLQNETTGALDLAEGTLIARVKQADF